MPAMNDLALPSPLANIHQYTAVVERFPRLDADEEKQLALCLRRDNDLEAAWRLITANLRHVVHIARGYAGYGLPQEDLIQEGNIGLMHAVRRYDPSRGTRLLSYAAIWIRAQIHDFILRNWRIVKVTTTKAKRKLFYKLRGAKQRLEWLRRDEARSIADALDVTTDDVIWMDGQLYSRDMPFDRPADCDDERPAPDSYLGDSGLEPAAMVAEAEFRDAVTEALEDALGTLDERSRNIIEARWLAEAEDKATLAELGERYGVSAERIRQVESAAIERLRQSLAPRLGVDCA